MRCPSCRRETPGAFSTCTHCNAPLTEQDDQWPPVPGSFGVAGEDQTRHDDSGEAPWKPGPLTGEPLPSASPWQQVPEPTRGDDAPWQPGSLGTEPAGQAVPSWTADFAADAPWQPGSLGAEPTAGDRTTAWGADDAPTEGPPAASWQPDAQPWEPGGLGGEGWGPQQPEPWRPDAAVPPPAQPYDHQQYGGQPYDPQQWQPQQQQPRKNRTTQLLIGAWAIVVVAAVAAIAIAFWPRGNGPSALQSHTTAPPADTTSTTEPANPTDSPTSPTSPPVSGDAAAQATAINGLLDSMDSSRTQLSNAVTAAGQCSGIDGALPTMDQVVSERQSELSTAQGLQVDALTSGDEMKTDLTNALQASLEADQAYTAWARGNQGCSGTTPQTGDLQNGNDISTSRATPAKQQFLTLWNPIAAQQGLPSRAEDHM